MVMSERVGIFYWSIVLKVIAPPLFPIPVEGLIATVFGIFNSLHEAFTCIPRFPKVCFIILSLDERVRLSQSQR